MSPAKTSLYLFVALTCSACVSSRGLQTERAPVTESEPGALAEIQISEGLSLRQPQPNTYFFTYDRPWSANSAAVSFEDGTLVLVDTPCTPEATESMVHWLKQNLEPKQIIAINSHYHVDANGGNQVLLEQGIPIYGQQLTAELTQSSGDSMLAVLKESVQDSQYPTLFHTLNFAAPDHLFEGKDGLVLTFGKQSLELYFPGHAHAPDNIVAYFPDHNFLFGGCMVKSTQSLGNIQDADLSSWLTAIRQVQTFDAEVIGPGHGSRLDRDILQLTESLLLDALSAESQ